MQDIDVKENGTLWELPSNQYGQGTEYKGAKEKKSRDQTWRALCPMPWNLDFTLKGMREPLENPEVMKPSRIRDKKDQRKLIRKIFRCQENKDLSKCKI